MPFDCLQNGCDRVSRLRSICKAAGHDGAGNELTEFGLRQLLQSSNRLIKFMQYEQEASHSFVLDVNLWSGTSRIASVRPWDVIAKGIQELVSLIH
jgi:hypothetical protein